jgi:hypothetical protein
MSDFSKKSETPSHRSEEARQARSILMDERLYFSVPVTRAMVSAMKGRHDDRKDARKQNRRLQGISLVLMISLFVLGVTLKSSRQNQYAVQLNQPVLLRVVPDRAEIKNVHYVRIILPDGVAFVSKEFPDIQNQNSLLLATDGKSGVPVVVAANKEGNKIITIEFLDKTMQRSIVRHMAISAGV